MNYNEALQAVDLVLEAGEVPLLVGATGIGKTTLANDIAAQRKWSLISIDGNLLKEGEIGGLPSIDTKMTVYAIHYKMRQVDELTDAGRIVLLFIDEINRCEHAVQQELMNLILNREINGYVLPNSVKIIAAMNPSDNYDYQTVEMDKAQVNRFVWLYLEPDYLQWLDWAEKSGIEEKIREFIATYPDYLSKTNEDISATPRSYERISELYRIYKREPERFSSKVFFNVIAGNVGKLIATELVNFLKNDYKPLLTYEEVFGTEELSQDVKKRVKGDTPTRLYLTVHNICREMTIKLSEAKNPQALIDRLVGLLKLYPVDLEIGLMKYIRNNVPVVAKVAMENKNFIDNYFQARGITR